MKSNAISTLLFIVILCIGVALGYPVYTVHPGESLWIVGSAFVLACLVASAVKIANPWDKAIVLRLGQFRSMKGPGLFFILPIIDKISYWIDVRLITTSFKAEKTLTKDTVPVDVNAVLFWKVINPKKAALEIADYNTAIEWASQTALRDIIGTTMLADMLEGRGKISVALQKIIDERTEPWGISVTSVEIKDVLIPATLENSMSMQAQAERERQARVILGDSEKQIARKFGEAAQVYVNNPTALHLRGMNMLYEGLKNNSTIVLVPSSAIESMDLGGLTGMTSLVMGLKQAKAGSVKSVPSSKEDSKSKKVVTKKKVEEDEDLDDKDAEERSNDEDWDDEETEEGSDEE